MRRVLAQPKHLQLAATDDAFRFCRNRRELPTSIYTDSVPGLLDAETLAGQKSASGAEGFLRPAAELSNAALRQFALPVRSIAA